MNADTFLKSRTGWIDAPDAVQVIAHRNGYGVALLIDGYYPDRDAAAEMADYFRGELARALSEETTR